MTSHVDVLVIGGGISGVAAALAASRAGARVSLVRRGPGATALAAGSWDAAPPEPLRTALADAGLPLEECSGTLPHPDGSLRSAPVAATAHARAALASGAGPVAERVVVCGIAGLPSFRPTALARLWMDATGLLDGSLEPALIELPGTPSAGWSAVSLAAAVEKSPHILGSAIAHASRARGAARAVVPAILGLTRHGDTLERVEQAAGLRVGEALGVAPSVPGWRLDRALLQLLADAGVDVIAGRVIGSSSERQAIAAISVETPTGPAALHAGTFVLATGRFIGGGIAAETAYVETALGCDVAIERFSRTITDPGAALVLTDPARLEPQPLLALGVRTDHEARPLVASGDVAWSNVYVAGTVRSGVEVTAGLGTCAHEGWNAGTRATARRAA